MALLQLFGLLFSYLTVNQAVHVQGSTPFCERCPCNSEPNLPPHINCIAAAIDNIYDTRFWFDNSNNASYSISSLVIKYNNLTVLKTKFPSSDLQVLDLSNNSISELGYSIFSQLQNLSELVLGYNEIEKIHPDVFRGVYNKEGYYPLPSLKTLDLKYNKLHTLDQDVFEHIDELQILNLSNNPFKLIDGQTLTAIASLVDLRVLDLSYTQIKTLPNYFMHTPKYLTELDLSGNNFESVPTTLGESHALQILYLNNNPIRNLVKPNVFPTIPTLKELHMSQMPVLEKIGAQALSGLKAMEQLHLSGNKRLTIIDSHALIKQYEKTWPPLNEIFMGNNNLSYLESRTILHLGRIKQLDLRGNPWSCDCDNQWFIHELMPIYAKINEMQAQELICKYPIEMDGQTLYNLSQKNSVMGCFYGNRLENDALLLVGALSGSLTVVLIFMFVVYVYRTKKLHRGPGAGGPQYARL